MAGKQQDSPLPSHPGDPLDLLASVAGEEDPGASIDLATPSGAALSPGRPEEPAGRSPGQPIEPQGHMHPGDQAPEGTPGTGETVCPRCGGSGKLGASACPECEGTGKITVGIGGA
jgi:hypothetical protein